MVSAGLACLSRLWPSRDFYNCRAIQPFCEVLDPEFRVVSGWEGSRSGAFLRTPPLLLVLGLRPRLGAVAAACEFAAPSRLPSCSLEQINVSGKSGSGYLRRDSLAEVGQDLNRAGFFAVVGFLGLWGRPGARRAAARPARPGAHVWRGGAREPWPSSRARESPVEWARRLGGQPRAEMCRPGQAGPLGTSCVHGKMAALRPCCRELKMEDAAARESGRVSHPHKGKGPFPLRPPLPVTPRCTRRRLGTSVSSR